MTQFDRACRAIVAAAVVVLVTTSIATAQSGWLDEYFRQPHASAGPVAPAPLAATPKYYKHWMHKDLKAAWAAGYLGKGATVSVIDDYDGNHNPQVHFQLGNTVESGFLGYFTSKQVEMLAPLATLRDVDFTAKLNDKVPLEQGLNIIALPGFGPLMNGSKLAESVLNRATKGTAVVVKGGDFDRAIGKKGPGLRDELDRDLIGTKSVIFVGALNKNGHKKDKAKLTKLSGFAGDNKKARKRFLVVGVPSFTEYPHFAAPIVASYAAIVGSKYKKATAIEVSNHLLNTTRTDTIKGYKKSLHGMGEACLSCALAPKKIK